MTLHQNLTAGATRNLIRGALSFLVLAGVLSMGAPVSRASSVIVPLLVSDQPVSWVGEGVNGSDDGQVSSTLGTCTAAGGGNSTCNLTGDFAFGGGGAYDFQITGPSPFHGVESTPTSGFYNLSFPNSTYKFALAFSDGLNATYVNSNLPGAPSHQFAFTFSFVNADATCTGVSSCSAVAVGATPGSTETGPVTWTLTVPFVPVPAPGVTVTPMTSPTGGGPEEKYDYEFSDLTGVGDVSIPIVDPSALVVSSLPSGVTIISDPTTIETDWPGSGNFVPTNETIFDDPLELLEVPEGGDATLDFSFLDTSLPVDGPILADGTLITDPLVPGPASVPEPGTLWLLGSALVIMGLASVRRSLRA